MAYDVRVVQEPERRLIAARRQASMSTLGAAFMEAFDAVYAHLNAHNVTERGHNVVYYTEVRVNGADMSFDCVIGVEVPADVATTDDIQMHATPAGEMATTVHWGDYSKLPEAHAAIHQWCEANGRRFGRNWEVYGDWHDNPAHVRTDVYYELTS